MAASAAATGEVRSSTQKVRLMPYSPTKERGLDVARNTNPYPVASEYTKKKANLQTYYYDGTSKEENTTKSKERKRVHAIHPRVEGFPNHTQSARAMSGGKPS